MSPGETALVDQAVSAFGAEVDVFIDAYRSLVQKGRGRDQAIADLCAYIYAELTHPMAAAAVTVAVVRLAEQDGE